jgi:hypothetical protein
MSSSVSNSSGIEDVADSGVGTTFLFPVFGGVVFCVGWSFVVVSPRIVATISAYVTFAGFALLRCAFSASVRASPVIIFRDRASSMVSMGWLV